MPISRTTSVLPIPDAQMMTFLPQSESSGLFALSSHLTWLLLSPLVFVRFRLGVPCVPPKHPTTELHPALSHFLLF